ncbi:beta strand repeat-containing protein [Erythrobacter sp.]|jgi:Ca2+-binding RTX toxin-like protein|uniref:beta strand repeat-containing protein n=1 Tax=Erythrobacter sp. TaxID=1042 RepID=UPI002EB146F8|nr:Calx-beta domain-containing protein [Erythrobacter sp.]
MERDLLILNPGSTTALAGGSFNIIGTTGDDETVILAPAAGTDLNVLFDPSFNGGDNVIRFEGDASEYTIARSGSSVIISGNGVTATIPVGLDANSIQFDDSSFALSFNTTTNSIELDDDDSDDVQTVDSTPTTIGVDDVNDAPNAVDDTDTVTEGQTTSGNVSLNDSDPDGDTLTYTLAAPVDGLTLNADGSYTFDASGFEDLEEGETETVTATVVASDGELTDTSTLTITVQGGDPAISVDSPTASEAAGSVTFTITLDEPSNGSTSVNFTTVSGSAIANQDFTPVSGTIVFVNGQQSANVTVPLLNDSVVEGDETFTLQANIQGNIVATGTATITDDDALQVALTTGIDDLEGSDSAENFTSNNVNQITLNDGDFIDGAGGEDRLTITSDGDFFDNFIVQNVETIAISNNENFSSFDFSGVSGLETIRVRNTTDGVFIFDAEASDVFLTNVFDNATVEIDYLASEVAGAGTAVTLTADNVTSGFVSLGSGIENLDLVLNGLFDVNTLDVSDASDIDITGSGNATVDNNFGADTKTVDASGATGALTFSFFGTELTYLGSAGADTIDLNSIGTVTAAFNAGDDVVTIDRTLTDDDSLFGGVGTDTLISNADQDDDSFTNVTGFEVLVLNDSDATLGEEAAQAGINTIQLNGNSTFDADDDFTNDLTVVLSNGVDNTFTTGVGDDTIDGRDGDFTIGFGDDIDAGDGDDTVLLDGDADLSNITGVENVDVTTDDDDADIFVDTEDTDVETQTITSNTGTGAFTFDGTTATSDLIVSSTSTSDSESIGTGLGDDVIRAGDGDSFISSSDGDDAINGNGGDDTIDGGNGADVILGGAGEDEIDGGDGDDALFGGSDADVLFGQDGDDILHGGGDADFLEGGDGADTFFYLSSSESTAGGIDLINDFDVAEDNIDISGLQDAAAQGLTINLLDGNSASVTSIAFANGTLAEAAIAARANDGNLDVAYDGTFLYFDVNDDGDIVAGEDLVIEVGTLTNSADIDVGDGDTVDASDGLDTVEALIDPFTLAEVTA